MIILLIINELLELIRKKFTYNIETMMPIYGNAFEKCFTVI